MFHTSKVAAFNLYLVGVFVCNVCLPPVSAQSWECADGAIRFATFNASLSKDQAGAMLAVLRSDADAQIKKVAEIIQIVRPDVLLINEFDYDGAGEGAAMFLNNYLRQPQNNRQPIDYPHVFSQPSNTGLLSGVDLNNDGKIELPEDGYGFGRHPGHYGMLVLSRFPIDAQASRTFQKFLWKDMPGALWPIDPRTGQVYYSERAQAEFRLSSKSHWNVVIQIESQQVHFLVSHPTPPVFDGPEDRNGARNHDEIRLWADYIGGRGDYLYDDQDRQGGLAADALFVIAGDQNADPVDGDSRERAILQLLDHPRVYDPMPRSPGGRQQAELQGGANKRHRGDPAFDTGDFNDRGPGNLRIDYVLPCRELRVTGSGVFWPLADQPEFELVDCSDHRLVWADVLLPREEQ
ncbi:MAG TPA: endonuclease/exonuclease/phosphatase family protein [Pirellulaceae bacterium]|nr:endonuclease/exonuclease/phosphatase family protein [Pirellulaceae bacterium]